MSGGQKKPFKRPRNDDESETLTAIHGVHVGHVSDKEEEGDDQDPAVDSSSSSSSNRELLVAAHHSILNVSEVSEQVAFLSQGFVYMLDAPTSASIRLGDDPLSYLNRDQVGTTLVTLKACLIQQF